MEMKSGRSMNILIATKIGINVFGKNFTISSMDLIIILNRKLSISVRVIMKSRRRMIIESYNSLYFFAVIPAKAGIHFKENMDARLRTSGMTDTARYV